MENLDMEGLRKIASDILEQGILMSLATQDEGGIWACAVNIAGGEDLNIYWISSPEVTHSKAISKNPRVAGTVTVSSGSREPNLGVQFSGIAAKVENAPISVVEKYFAKRGKQMPGTGEDFLKGRSWYRVKPDFFDIIHESLWGFKKQKLVL